MDTRASKRNARRSKARKLASEEREQEERTRVEEKERRDVGARLREEEIRRREEEARAEEEQIEMILTIQKHNRALRESYQTNQDPPEEPPEIVAIKEKLQSEQELRRVPGAPIKTFVWEHRTEGAILTVWQSATTKPEARFLIKTKMNTTLLGGGYYGGEIMNNAFYDDNLFTFGFVMIDVRSNDYLDLRDPEVYEAVFVAEPGRILPFDKGSGLINKLRL